MFEAIRHTLPSGKSPACEMEDQLNEFLEHRPELTVVATRMNTSDAPAEPNALPSSEESATVIFCALLCKP